MLYLATPIDSGPEGEDGLHEEVDDTRNSVNTPIYFAFK